jgi:hypothetical protein
MGRVGVLRSLVLRASELNAHQADVVSVSCLLFHNHLPCSASPHRLSTALSASIDRARTTWRCLCRV